MKSETTNYPLLIPNIITKIEQKLKELGLTPEVSPGLFVEKTRGKKHRYSSVCSNQQGKKLLFYAILHKSPSEQQRTKTEVRLAKYFAKHPLKCLPKYYNGKIEKDFSWLTRELLPDLPIETLGKIETLKRAVAAREFKNLAFAIFQLNSLPAKRFPFLKKFNLNKYTDLPSQIAKDKILDQPSIEKINQLIKSNLSLLKKENNCFTHGDLQIGNIILFARKIKIIDLESAHFNNFAFDIAFIATRMWQHLKERQDLIKYYSNFLPQQKKEVFQTLFRIDSIFVGFHTFKSSPREYTTRQLQKRRAFYKKLLIRASGSFNQLANLS